MSTANKVKIGWGKLPLYKQWHFFVDGASICRSYLCSPQTELTFHPEVGSDPCFHCASIYNHLQQQFNAHHALQQEKPND